MKKVLFILGPTGVGKSDMAVKLAQKFNGEIISADSVQIFRQMNIGSAKITEEEMCGVKHHCIDILNPNDEFSVFDFVELTKNKIDEIISRGKLPIICGGTGLYVKSLVLGYDFGGSGKDSLKREELKKIADEKGLAYLYEKLKAVAPSLAEKISVNDEKRIIRGLEIAESEVMPSKKESDIDPLIIGLNMDRAKLYERINFRAQKMFDLGLIEEVHGLLDCGVDENSQSMKAIGYKEVVAYFKNEISKEDMIELVKKHSRNYAKRQLTFMRGIEGLIFVDVEDREKGEREIIEKVEKWLW